MARHPGALHAPDGSHRARFGGPRNIVVNTPTASGKTLCYNAPILNSILQDRSNRVLYLFATKALAQDQLAELQLMCETLSVHASEEIGIFTYDGDTP